MFTTNELIDMSTSIVVKHSDGHITAFSRDKLFLSLLRAVGHRAQPINDAGALVATVMTKLHPKAVDAAIAAHDIVKTTYDTLRHFDTAAAVQYRAYHKS